MSRHEGVSCDSCLKSNFSGRRYKCLICYDYDLCADCFEEGVTSTRHLVEHPMQCILTRNDYELFFGGEMLTSEQPQSYTCPYCNKMGFSDATLLEHVTTEHTEASLEVVCPVCASMPGGEPNLVTDDFAGHLTLEHRTGPRELCAFLDEPSAIRHGGGVRRMPGRSLGGPRTRRSNMQFSSASGLSALSPSGRESVDPIAELLSQLSGARRGGPQSSQLQQLQMQLQLERQQQATRQQLERLPRRAHQLVSSSNSNATMAEVVSGNNMTHALLSHELDPRGGINIRSNEWTVNTSSPIQSSQSNLSAANANIREVILNSSFMNANEIGLSPYQFLQTNGAAISNGNSNSNTTLSAAAVGNGGTGGVGATQNNSGNSGATSGNNDASQSHLLLTKFTQPTLSDEELAEQERCRIDRSQFVQAMLTRTLNCTKIEEIAEQLNRRAIIFRYNNNGDNNKRTSERASTGGNNANAAATGDNVNADAGENADIARKGATDAASQTSFGGGGGGLGTGGTPGGQQQVHQHQQTSPEDFSEEHHKSLPLQQPQHPVYAARKKAANAGGGRGAGGERGIDKRGRPPPPPFGGNTAGATAAGSQQQQQQQQQQGQGQQQSQQKYKQQSAAAATMNNSGNNQVPDTR